MNKKMIVLVLAAVSATTLAISAAALANPALHVSGTPSFTVTGGKEFLTRADNNNIECTALSGLGSFTATTTGKVALKLTGCKIPSLGASCQSGATAGEIVATELEFHLTTVAEGVRGILLTSNAGHFATYKCFGITSTLTGAGTLGEITAPACGASSTEGSLSFSSTSAGTSKHTTFTGTTYDLTSTVGGSAAAASLDAAATVKFGSSQTLTCT